MAEEQAPKQIVPEEDLKPLMDEVDRILGLPPGAGGAPAPGGPEGMPPEGMPPEAAMEELPAEAIVEEEVVEEAAPAEDVTPIADALGVSPERAQELFDAAQQIGSLEGASVQEVADALSTDFQLRMQVEKIAGRSADEAAEMEPVEEIEEVIEEDIEV